jgi:hypothetical protein
VMGIDPVRGDPQCGESFALDGEVLFVGGASGVSDEKRRHGAPPGLGRHGAVFAPFTGNGDGRWIQVHPRENSSRARS